jgi:phospholipase A-2-activating protein
MDNEGNPVGEFMGHNGTINSISQSKDDNNLFISGSWDTTARIWDLNKQENISILEGHSYAVTVLALPNKKYVTGSQDKNLYFWDGDRKVNTVQNAHDDIIRSIILSPDSQSLFTTSNDMKIKQWSLNGQLLNTFNAHDGFIFNLCFNLKSHQLFSCGDDRVVKVWKENGNYEQSLLHPNTIWDAAYNPINDDILTACADSILRVFSNNNKRWMNENALKEYNNLCNLAAAQSEGEGNNQGEQVDINTLPSITEMSNLKNIKDGEIRLFNNFGKAEAYCYKKSEDKWELLGEVMGQKKCSSKKILSWR